MYSIMFGPRARVALGVFLVLGTGCAEFKKDDALKGSRWRGPGEVHTQTPLEISLRSRISELEKQLRSAADSDHWSQNEIKDLQNRCGEGFMPDGSARFKVSTASTPQALLKAVNSVYSAAGIEEHTGRKLVRTIDLDNATYPDVICFKFSSGGRTCFDPMELTER